MRENVQNSVLDEVVDSIGEQMSAQGNGSTYDEQLDNIDGIYIFISFDLVNSTLFKSRHMHLWPKFISAFYECVLKGFGIGQFNLRVSPSEGYEEQVQKTNGFHLWKLVGDEVLLYHKVVSKDELYDTILFVEKMQNLLIEDTIKKCLGNEPKDDAQRVEYDNNKRLFKRYFAIKATVWIGNCTEDVQNVDMVRQNVVFDQMVQDNEASVISRKLDFLGPDIDEGFRVCEFAEKNKMIVTPKLVYLLMKAYDDKPDKQTVLVSNFKIVNYVSMKGVWEQRLYPIIMFCQNDINNPSSLENWKKQFDYDAFETSKLYENINQYGEKFLTDNRFSIKNLQQIYHDIVREDEMNCMVQCLKEQEEKIKPLKGIGPRISGNFEFHVACLCYDEEKQAYWLIKHQTHGWSFGCIRVQKNEEYLEYVKEAYKRKYELHISLSEETPLISFYEANREPIGKGMILGVVLLVKGASGDCQKDGIESGWYTYEEIMDGSTLSGKKSKGFNEIIDKAQRMIKK